MEQNEKARYKKWFPFTTYDLDELNNRDIVFCLLDCFRPICKVPSFLLTHFQQRQCGKVPNQFHIIVLIVFQHFHAHCNHNRNQG